MSLNNRLNSDSSLKFHFQYFCPPIPRIADIAQKIPSSAHISQFIRHIGQFQFFPFLLYIINLLNTINILYAKVQTILVQIEIKYKIDMGTGCMNLDKKNQSRYRDDQGKNTGKFYRSDIQRSTLQVYEPNQYRVNTDSRIRNMRNFTNKEKKVNLSCITEQKQKDDYNLPKYLIDFPDFLYMNKQKMKQKKQRIATQRSHIRISQPSMQCPPISPNPVNQLAICQSLQIFGNKNPFKNAEQRESGDATTNESKQKQKQRQRERQKQRQKYADKDEGDKDKDQEWQSIIIQT